MRCGFRFCLLLLLLCPLWGTLSANVAMPGIYGAGGASGFHLLFPEDSLVFETIEMRRERVVVQLYPGYAVIKGTYWMANPTSDTLRMHMGYPINGVYESDQHGAQRFEIFFDDLYAMEVYTDDQAVMVYQDENNGPGYGENWYLWEQTFAPDTITRVEVFFMVNTNDASVLQGYTKDQHNAFLYLLESGRAWDGVIGEGEVLVQLMPPLQLSDVWGGMPDSSFVYLEDKQILRHRFQDWEPMAGENIGLVYGKRIEAFDFAAKLEEAEALFDSVERLSNTDFSASPFESITLGDIYQVHSFNWAGLVMGLLGFGIPLMVIFAIILVLRAVYRKISPKSS